MADKAQAFCGRWLRNEPTPSLLVLVGESGGGKTHVARKISTYAEAVCMVAWERGAWKTGDHVTRQTMIRWPETCDRFKEGDYSAIEDATQVGLLVIDDIGAEHDPSKNAADKLCQILSRRERRFTVITTNIKPEEWGTRFDSRTADRLMRNSEVVTLDKVGSYALK